MNLKLHEETVALVREERRLTGLVIANLQKISDARLFLEMSYSSLFEYCTKALGYSEASAYRRIQAVKIARIIPEVREKLDSGALNLTNLSMAQSLISSDNLSLAQKREVVERLENRSKREAEKIVADIAVKIGVAEPTRPKEKLRHVSSDAADLSVRLNASTLEKLQRIKALRSHKNPNMSHADLIDDMCDLVLKKIDPTLKAPTRATQPPKAHALMPRNPRYISAKLKTQIWQRDGGQCTFANGPHRCDSRHLLQIDHIRPLARGGETTAENLRLLCHAHHKDRDREFAGSL